MRMMRCNLWQFLKNPFRATLKFWKFKALNLGEPSLRKQQSTFAPSPNEEGRLFSQSTLNPLYRRKIHKREEKREVIPVILNVYFVSVFFDFQCNLDDTFPPSNEFILVG